MYLARSILAVLFFFSSVGAVKTVFASEDSSSVAMKAEDSPAFQSSQASNVLGQVATALAGGSEAMRALRGSPDEYGQKDRLQPPLPEMNCGIDRILSFVSCYSALINNAEQAENVFQQLVDDVKGALPSDRWGTIQARPRVGSVRSISYQDRKTGARIDIELLVRSAMEGHSSYDISLYGWTGF